MYTVPKPLFELVAVTRDNIKPGLVLRFPASDGSVHAFNDTVIESIDGENVTLVRPYCFFKDGVVQTDCERFTVSISRIIRSMYCVMEGSSPHIIHTK